MRSTGPPPSDLAETHISTVAFVGDRAYKWLKPVKTGFLDHSAVGPRLRAVDRELELNRRLAPDVYLATADIVEEGEVVDRVLVMRRLPHHRRLSALVGTEEFDSALRMVARAVAVFHSRLEPHTEPTGMATSGGMAALWESSFAEIEPSVGREIDREEFESVRWLARRYLEHNDGIFERRRELGMVRDGHGDLTAEDIFILDDGPRILDCLAFDDDLRISDVLADIGFLAMDVHRLAGPDPARRLMGWYTEFSGESHPSSLAHHYVAYRAHIRAKIELIRHRQGVAAAAPAASTYHQLAFDHLRRAQLRLVLVGGGPGSGKTTLAHAIADRSGWLVIGSDEVRKDLCGVPHDRHVDEAAWSGMYDRAITERTYQTLIDQAELSLRAGESVILDASWTARRHRDLARAMARRVGADLCELECSVPAAVARLRVASRRAQGGDSSDAIPDTVDLMAARWEEWSSSERIDTEGDLNDSLRQALGYLLSRVGPDVSSPGVAR
jgi:aminoglycoside phosphotransferase family enzyme/predicted kinase